MSGFRQKFPGLCLPPILFCVLDFTLTLVFQPAEYWQGKGMRPIECACRSVQRQTACPAFRSTSAARWKSACFTSR
jgi:hypothetical protein